MSRILPHPPAEVIPILENDNRKRAFFDEHWAQLARDYPDQYVAVKDGSVALADPDFNEFHRSLHELGLRHPTGVWVKLIAVTKRNFIPARRPLNPGEDPVYRSSASATG